MNNFTTFNIVGTLQVIALVFMVFFAIFPRVDPLLKRIKEPWVENVQELVSHIAMFSIYFVVYLALKNSLWNDCIENGNCSSLDHIGIVAFQTGLIVILAFFIYSHTKSLLNLEEIEENKIEDGKICRVDKKNYAGVYTFITGTTILFVLNITIFLHNINRSYVYWATFIYMMITYIVQVIMIFEIRKRDKKKKVIQNSN